LDFAAVRRVARGASRIFAQIQPPSALHYLQKINLNLHTARRQSAGFGAALTPTPFALRPTPPALPATPVALTPTSVTLSPTPVALRPTPVASGAT